MVFIREALARLRTGSYEAQIQQSADFIGSLPLPIAENVGVLAVVLNGINRGFPDASFSLVGQRVLAPGQFKGPPRRVDFLIINSAKPGTPLRERALDYLNGELHRHFTSRNGSLLRTVYESEAYRVMEVCYGSTPTRFYITGKKWDDSYTFKAAASVNNNGYALLNLQP